MKNFEKYPSEIGASTAFLDMCTKNEQCKECKYYSPKIGVHCSILWLYDEAEPTPLPKEWSEQVMNKFTRKD